MTARDYEAEALENLSSSAKIPVSDDDADDARTVGHALALATLEVAKQVRRVADAMERDMAVAHKALTEGLDERTPLDVALIERALDVDSPWDVDLVRLALAELRRWKEQQP